MTPSTAGHAQAVLLPGSCRFGDIQRRFQSTLNLCSLVFLGGAVGVSPLPGPALHFWIQIYIYIFIGQEFGAAKDQKFTPKTNCGWSKKQLGEGGSPTTPCPHRLWAQAPPFGVDF